MPILLGIAAVGTAGGAVYLGLKAWEALILDLNSVTAQWSHLWSDIIALFVCTCGVLTAAHSVISLFV